MRATAGSTAGHATGGVRSVLLAEAVAALAIVVILYIHGGSSWAAFAVLFLVPDLALLGYLIDARTGAAAYNVAHSYVGPLVLAGIGLSAAPAVLPYALIWLAHCSFDRALGYGLKYSSAFGRTHLGRVGRASA
jgi:hypothetical protein